MPKRVSLTRLQDHETNARTALAKKRQALAIAAAQLKEAETRALRKQSFVVGKLAVEAGLGGLRGTRPVGRRPLPIPGLAAGKREPSCAPFWALFLSVSLSEIRTIRHPRHRKGTPMALDRGQRNHHTHNPTSATAARRPRQRGNVWHE